MDNNSSQELVEPNLEAQLALTTTPTTDSTLLPPPPYSRRRRYQRLDIDPPSYSSVLITPPPGQPITKIPLTIRYVETLVLEDDGYFKVVCPTARKFRTNIKVYDSMDWYRFWECLRQLKPSLTLRENGLKEVRGLRRKGKWERKGVGEGKEERDGKERGVEGEKKGNGKERRRGRGRGGEGGG